MKSAVIVFPGLNRDRDMIAALTSIGGKAPAVVWHQDHDLPDVDLIVIPGGFSYGDYLRAGAIAARSPIMDAVRKKAAAGVRVLGVCNGFQILTEAKLLPGVLMRNASLKFVCREVKLSVANADTEFHLVAIENSANPYLISAYRLISSKVSALRSHRSTALVKNEASAEHFDIVEKLENDDLPGALAALNTHILKMAKRYDVEPMPGRRATGRAPRSSSLDQFSPLLD